MALTLASIHLLGRRIMVVRLVTSILSTVPLVMAAAKTATLLIAMDIFRGVRHPRDEGRAAPAASKGRPKGHTAIVGLEGEGGGGVGYLEAVGVLP